MAGIEVGQVCVKTRGREAGKKAVVIQVKSDNAVLIDGPSIRKRRCNIMHLYFTKEKLNLKENAPHAEVLKQFEMVKE